MRQGLFPVAASVDFLLGGPGEGGQFLPCSPRAPVWLDSERLNEIHATGVLPQWHGRGRGKQLVAHAQDVLRRVGAASFE